jgi:hypothetical protein
MEKLLKEIQSHGLVSCAWMNLAKTRIIVNLLGYWQSVPDAQIQISSRKSWEQFKRNEGIV